VAYPPDDGGTVPAVPLDTPGPRHRLTMDPAGWRFERTAGTEPPAGTREG
jgi:hypothetical protein